MKDNKNVLFVGCINWDFVLHTDSIPEPDHSGFIKEKFENIGGSAANSALVLSNIDGFNVNLAGTIGKDKQGKQIEKILNENNITQHLSYCDDEPTTFIQALITKDADPRYYVEYTDLDNLTIHDIDNWDEIDHVHITSFHRYLTKKFSEKAKQVGATVSFNPSQNYHDETFYEVIQNSDLIILNKTESELFTSRNGPINNYIDKGKEIVITHGAAGCTYYKPDEVKQHSGFNVESVVDTVGAGDSFTAGFLSGWLDENVDDLETLKRANAYGASAVKQKGAPNKIPYPEQFI